MSRFLYPIRKLKVKSWIKYWLIKKTSYIPKEYIQLKYIEGTGTQFIDLGFKGNENYNYRVKFLQKEYGGLIVGTAGTTSNNYSRIFITGERLYLDIYGGYSRISVENSELLNKLNNWEFGNRYVKNLVTNEYLLQANPVSSFETVTNYTVFGDGSSKAKLQLFSLEVYNNTELIRKYIPCIRKIDNKVGLYETINKVFYENNGTGEFIYE